MHVQEAARSKSLKRLFTIQTDELKTLSNGQRSKHRQTLISKERQRQGQIQSKVESHDVSTAMQT